ncbi:N-formylglutamate amidohydrolase [Sphingomonas sp.]|uniref:N-formylglutamate amidohydrolase n=1 Tax=Sphingomonas sp. TaxID=28214 RepID=UPI003B3A8427
MSRTDQPSETFTRLGPASPASPIILSVPHAGRDYPDGLIASAAVPASTIRGLEDRLADLLIAHAVDEGATAFVARLPRAWIDLNRGEEDLPPALRSGAGKSAPTARARQGLGLIPDRIGRQPLWRVLPSPSEAQRRIAVAHGPYHAAIAAALEAARHLFGYAVLIDCHSMPPLGGYRPARIVIGDRQGRSAMPGLGLRLTAAARDMGYAAALNAPYAGAYTLERHGRPEAGIHAVQIEVDRTLYLAPNMRDPAPGLDRVRALIARLAREAAAVAQSGFPLAAE